jgi:hypothetical protein
MRMIKACAVLRTLILLFLLTPLSTHATEPQQPSQQQAGEEELVPFQSNFNFAASPSIITKSDEGKSVEG